MEIPVDLKIKIQAFISRIEELPSSSQIKTIVKGIQDVISQSGLVFQKDVERFTQLVEELKKIRIEIPGVGNIQQLIDLLNQLKQYSQLQPSAKKIYVPGEKAPVEPQIVLPYSRFWVQHRAGRLFEELEKEQQRIEAYRKKFISKGLEVPVEDLTRLKLLYSIYNQILKNVYDTKNAQEILNNLSKENAETLKDILKNKQNILENAKRQQDIYQGIEEQLKRLQAAEEKQKEVKTQITKEEIKRARLLDLINEYYKDPYIAKYLQTQGEINTKTTEELQIILNKIYALRVGSGILYRQRLEWDRIGNTLRYIGMVFTGIYTAGIRNAAYFAVEILRGKGALELTTQQAIALNFIGRTLGITFTDLIQGIGNVYQALINAGQGTSFVAARVREALSSIGITALKLGQQMTAPYDMFWKVIFALKELEVTLGRSWVAQKLLGSEFEKLAPFLALSTEELKDLKQQAEQFSKSLGINTENIQKDFLRFSILIEQIRLFIISFFADTMKTSAEFFKNLRERMMYLIEIWKQLPQGIKVGISYILLLLGPGSLLVGSFIRFADNIQRVINGLLGLKATVINTFSAVVQLISASNPIVLGFLFTLYAAISAFTVYTQRREQALKKQIEYIDKQEQMVGRYSKIIQQIKREEEKGFKSTIASADELEKKFYQLRSEQLKLEHEGKPLEAYKVWGKDFVNLLNKVWKEVLEWRKSRQDFLITEDLVKQKLQETEIQIKEQNLSLSEQYKLYSEIYQLAIRGQIKQELINQILEKRSTIVYEAIRAFQNLEAELDRPIEEIPFLKSFIDGLNKLKELEDKLIVIRQAKSFQEYSKYEDLLQRYRLNLRKKFENELNEEELKTVRELAQIELRLGKWNIENYYKAMQAEEKKYLLEKEKLHKWGQELISKVEQIYPDKAKEAKELLNSRLILLDKSYAAAKNKIWSEIVDDMISLYRKEDEAYSILLKNKELGENQLNTIYARRFDLINNLIQQINQLPEFEGKRLALLELENRKIELQIELENKRESVYDREYNKVKKLIDQEENRFQKVKRTVEEELTFYRSLYFRVGSLDLPAKAKEKVLDELAIKIRNLERDNFNEQKQILQELVSLHTLSYEERLYYLNQYLEKETAARQRGYITHLEGLKDITTATVEFIKAEFLRLRELSPLSPVEDAIIKVLGVIYNNLVQFKDDIERVKPEERFYRLYTIISEIFNQVKELTLSKPEVEKIFNNTEIRAGIENLINLFQVSSDRVDQLLDTMKIQLLGSSRQLMNFFNQIKDVFQQYIKLFSDRTYTISERIQRLFIDISRQIEKFFVEEFLERIPIKEKVRKFFDEFLKSVETGEFDISGFTKYFFSLFSQELSLISRVMQNFEAYFEQIDLKERFLKRLIDLRNSFKEGITGFVKELGQGVYSITYQVEQLLNKIGRQVYEFLVEGFIERLNLKDKLAAFINSILESFQLGNYDFSVISDAFKKFSAETVDAIMLFYEQLKSFLEQLNLRETILNLKRNLFDEILNAFSEFSRDVLLKGQDLIGALQKLKLLVADAIFKFLVEQILITKIFTQEFKEQLSEAIDLAIEGNYSMLNRLIENFAAKVESLIPVVDRIMNRVIKAFALEFETVANELDSSISSFQEDLGVIEEVIESATNRFSRLLEARERFRARFMSRPLRTWILGEGFFTVPVLGPYSKTLNVNFYGLSFNEQRRVFDFWQDRNELADILGVAR